MVSILTFRGNELHLTLGMNCFDVTVSYFETQSSSSWLEPQCQVSVEKWAVGKFQIMPSSSHTMPRSSGISQKTFLSLNCACLPRLPYQITTDLVAENSRNVPQFRVSALLVLPASGISQILGCIIAVFDSSWHSPSSCVFFLLRGHLILVLDAPFILHLGILC